jgi:2-hydroxy-3-keto-5-methylthiopentenyl-1-phosphate phosphatase
VVSDGLGLHIEPMLGRAGVRGLDVLTNVPAFNGGGLQFDFPNGHPVCRECGTCKMLAVTSARVLHGPVAYVGDGHSDRYGAVYSDLVFAKGFLAEHCRAEGPWETFEDVWFALEGRRAEDVPGPIDPERCPGWRDPAPTCVTETMARDSPQREHGRI